MVSPSSRMVSTPSQAIVKQMQRDRKVHGLIDTMASMYAFMKDANPLEKIKSYERTDGRLVRQTTDCAYFITAYVSESSFGKYCLSSPELTTFISFLAQRTVTHIMSNTDELIARFEASFGELKVEFIIGCALQAAITTVRILEKAENIREYSYLEGRLFH